MNPAPSPSREAGRAHDAGHAPEAACALCLADGGRVLVRGAEWRVVLANESDYPALTRVIWRAHVSEMSDLRDDERRELFGVVLQVESVQRRVLAPDKINLASLGNQVPHLHWHVIPRWRDDRHFPEAIWAKAPQGRQRASAARIEAVRMRIDEYVDALRSALDRGSVPTGRR